MRKCSVIVDVYLYILCMYLHIVFIYLCFEQDIQNTPVCRRFFSFCMTNTRYKSIHQQNHITIKKSSWTHTKVKKTLIGLGLDQTSKTGFY